MPALPAKTIFLLPDLFFKDHQAAKPPRFAGGEPTKVGTQNEIQNALFLLLDCLKDQFAFVIETEADFFCS